MAYPADPTNAQDLSAWAREIREQWMAANPARYARLKDPVAQSQAVASRLQEQRVKMEQALGPIAAAEISAELWTWQERGESLARQARTDSATG